MAITLSAGPVAGGNVTTGSTITLAITPSTGDALVVGVVWRNSAHTISSITCSGESNLTVHGSPTAEGGGRSAQFASLNNVTVGEAKTVTITMSAGQAGSNYAVAFVMAVAGHNSGSFYDTTAGATGTSAAPSVNITTANANALVCALCAHDGGGTPGDPAAGSGYTLVALTDGGQFNSGEYDLDVGVAGSVAAGFSLGGSATWVVKAASFNALAASPTITPGVGSLALTGIAPTVGGDRSATPTTGALALTGATPVVSTSMSPSLMPAAATMSFTGYAPTVSNANSGTAAINLLVHTVSAEGYGGPYASITTLGHTVAAEGVAGATSSAALTLLGLEISAGGNEHASLTLLVHELSASSLTGTTGAAAVTGLVPSLSAAGLGNTVGTAANDLLYHSSEAAGLVGNDGELSGTLAIHRIEATAFGGNSGSAAISLLLHTTSTVGFAAITGSAAITLAGHYLEAAGFPTLAETYRTWVINLRNQALTEYDNFEFNSFAYFDGKYLAAGPGGIVELGAAELDGADTIGWRVRTGSVDYGSTYLKRVPRMYVTGEFGGATYFRTITSEDGERTYLLSDNGIRGDQQRRIPIGKGPKSLQWAYELEDAQNGADVRISRLLPYPDELKRRAA